MNKAMTIVGIIILGILVGIIKYKDIKTKKKQE